LGGVQCLHLEFSRAVDNIAVTPRWLIANCKVGCGDGAASIAGMVMPGLPD
jgi:hypothetical protein